MEALMTYVQRSEVFDTEKAYTVDLPVEHVPGAERSNFIYNVQPVKVKPITHTDQFKLDVHGFCVIQALNEIDPDAAFNRKDEIKDDYWRQIEDILHTAFPRYSRIEAFDLTIRRRDADFPKVLRSYRKQYEQPAATAHADYSCQGAQLVLRHCFPNQEGFWKDQDKDFDFLNVWRPLNVTDDWPLVFCDFTTVDTENDILLTDSVRRDVVDETSLLHHNKAHKWYYLPNQGADKLMVFRNTDAKGQRARAFHAAVNNPLSHGPPRASVEVRLVAFL